MARLSVTEPVLLDDAVVVRDAKSSEVETVRDAETTSLVLLWVREGVGDGLGVRRVDVGLILAV